METFFEEMEKGNKNSNKLKTIFEEIYWKCPDIIIHIELNLRNIYLRRQTQIDKYFEKEKIKLLKQWEKTTKEIINTYMGIKIQKRDAKLQDKKMLLEQFTKGELNIDNYTDEKVENYYLKILSNKIDKNHEEIQKSILEFLNSLYEYFLRKRLKEVRRKN